MRLKIYFMIFVKFSQKEKNYKACLLTSTAWELGTDGNSMIMEKLEVLQTTRSWYLTKNYQPDKSKSEAIILKQTNFLLIAKQGLTNSTKVFGEQELYGFIETTFESIKKYYQLTSRMSSYMNNYQMK